MPREQRRFNVRRTNVTACMRCRSRKQRCDQKIPACSNCGRAGVECVSTDSDGRVVPRSYVRSLEDQIAYLETQLAAHGVDYRPSMTPSVISAGRSIASPGFSNGAREGSGDLIGQIADDCARTQPFSTGILNKNGLYLLQSLLSDPMSRVAQAKHQSDSHSLLDELPSDELPAVPRRETADKFADVYFEHCNFFSPIFSSKHEFLDMLEPLYDEDNPNPDQQVDRRFRAFVVFGTSILLLNRVDFSIPASKSEKYFHAAIRLFANNPEILCTRDIQHLINLLFIIQYFCFASNISAAWHFLGLATRLAIELNLHRDSKSLSSTNERQVNERRWLFWSLYTFERNLCVIIGRPFSFSDQCIETPLPVALPEEPHRALAVHLLKHRILESEIYTTLNEKQPSNGAVLDIAVWRDSVQQRLHEWHSAVPPIQQSTHLTPAEIFNGSLYNTQVLLYYPSRHFPNPSTHDLAILARSATDAIDCYSQSFRAGELRFFWRTVHNLFRSGVAIVYCSQASQTQHIPGLSAENATASINSCSSLLWGMVERYPAGRPYRDIFDRLSNSILRQRRSADELNSRFFLEADADTSSIFADISLDPTIVADLPSAAFDTLLWGIKDPLDVI
ncbi:fungal-specific transcription factor domain-containing protein [Aspergillus granulosus]|uniref:Fungal-specific transcription factor domain-containing protein n=1 Tax=Aspergillus granulosus TaxID=176169 RepID=A0ABR4H6M6_9EURO